MLAFRKSPTFHCFQLTGSQEILLLIVLGGVKVFGISVLGLEIFGFVTLGRIVFDVSAFEGFTGIAGALRSVFCSGAVCSEFVCSEAVCVDDLSAMGKAG